MPIEVTFDDVESFIQRHVNEKIAREKDDKKTLDIDRKILLEQLTEAQVEVEGQYKRALAVWKKAIVIYTKHIQENPGSLQVRNPGDMPKYPRQYDTVKTKIKTIRTIRADVLHLTMSELNEFFIHVSEATNEARNTTLNYIAQTSGGTVNWLNSSLAR